MAYNGSGVFSRLYNWVNDAAAGINIRADRMDAELNGIATGLSTCITKNGQTPATANLPMGGYRHTGVGDALQDNQYASLGQLNTAADTAAGTAKVSADDEEANYLGAKVAEGDYMQITEAEGGNEVLTFSVDAAGIAELSFTTGDVKLTLKTVADAGWVMFDDGTIGNASSGATTRANADTEALFTLLWTNVSNTYAAVSGGRGASAAADYAANKTIALTKMLGRALGIAGAGSGLTSRAIGFTVGEETHVLLEAEMPAHTHSTAFKNDSTSAGTVPYATASTGATAANVNTSSKGSGTAHNNMQPTTFLNAMVKL